MKVQTGFLGRGNSINKGLDARKSMVRFSVIQTVFRVAGACTVRLDRSSVIMECWGHKKTGRLVRRGMMRSSIQKRQCGRIRWERR